MSRVGAGETAFGDRSAPILLGIEANWEEPGDDGANVAWARETVAGMRRFSGGGIYLNFPGFLEEGQEMMRDAYGENQRSEKRTAELQSRQYLVCRLLLEKKKHNY